MLNKTLTALALAVATSTPAMAGVRDIGKAPIIDLSHTFYELPDTTISVEACTYDRHLATIRGVVQSDKTEEQALALNGLPVKRFQRDLQIAFSEAMTHYTSRELIPEDSKDFNQGSFKGINQTFHKVTRAYKDHSRITMVFMPRIASVGPVSDTCPVLKK